MIVDQLFTPKLIKEGTVYDLGREYGAPPPEKKKRSQDPDDYNPYPFSPEEDEDYFREIFRKKREAAKQAKQHKLDESVLLEDPIYRDFKRVGSYIAEAKLSQAQILQIFADAEAGMTDRATGANRTFLGKGKDATVDFAKDVAGAVKGVLNSIQTSVPVSAVDVAYDQATDALGDLVGGQKGAVMDAIKKYRNLVKQYPKTAGFAKAALVAIAGLATGGAGLPAIAGLTYALDSAIKGDKLSSVLGKGVGAAALAAAGQAIHGGATQPSSGGPADTSAFTNVNQIGDHTGEYVTMPDGSDTVVSPLVAPTPDLATYTVQPDDNLSTIAARFNTSVAELKGLNPQLAAASGATGGQSMNPDVIFPGQQITLPPGTPGTDVYAGSVGTSADTMSQIAKGNIPDSAISQGMAAKGQAAANTATARTVASSPLNIDLTTNSGTVTLPDGETMKAAVFPASGQMQPRLPIGMETVTVPYNGQNVTGYIGNGIVYFPNFPAVTAVKESIKYRARILPASKLIDQKATVLSWALNESVGRKSKSVNLTTVGTYTVFENIERYRRAIMELKGVPGSTRPEYYRPDMMSVPAKADKKPGLIGRGLNWLDKKVGQVGGALSNFGHQFTTNVTKEKLKMNWHQAGKPSDSDALAAWLVTQGVPQEVVTSVYGKMGIPYTAPAVQPTSPATTPAVKPTVGGAQRTSYSGSINPATGKEFTGDEIRNKFFPSQPATTDVDSPAPASTTPPTPTPAATVPASGQFPGEDPQGPGYVGRREVARRQAARAAQAGTKPAAPNFAQQNAGYKSVNYAPNIKTGVSLPKPTTPAGTRVTTGGPTANEKAKLDQRIAQALKQPVAEMLQMVETKEDVQRIKQFVDETFVRYGVVNESSFAIRNQILDHVTQVGARRRREYSQQLAN